MQTATKRTGSAGNRDQMKKAYEYNVEAKIVTICAFHARKSQLEARAAREHPDAPVSHGICEVCAERVRLQALEPRKAWIAPKRPSKAWLADAQAEIAAVNEAARKPNHNETIPPDPG